MIENLQLGLDLLLEPQALIYLTIGVAAGFLVGVLPGFASSNAAAILLPFTLILPTEVALLFLVGIYAGASFAGGVPAILLNVPGTGSAAATALDGYPMARAGKAERAVGLARMASVVGGVIGTAITIVAIGPMARVSLQFGSVEMFLLAAFGLSIIATVVGKSTTKGLLSGILGMAIAAMSADGMMGQARFTMGFAELYDQVPFVPALIGLFAVSQMLQLAGAGPIAQGAAFQDDELAEGTARMKRSLREFRAGVVMTLRYPKTLLRSSLIGTFIGAIPGAGTAVATFVSYGEEKRRSKTPERFGHGAPEGVIAAECAENATTAGTLVPTLALGIPGSATAAIMLAALYLHGVLPGPRVMSENAGEAYAVLLGLGLASLLILPLGLVLATPMTYIVKVQPKYLVPLVLVVCMIGAYAVRIYTFDARLALVFGVLGLIMKLTGYPVIPLVLGLILGPLAEVNFVRSLQLGGFRAGYFFERPMARGLWALLALSVLYNIFSVLRERRRDRVGGDDGDETPRRLRTGSTLPAEPTDEEQG